MGCTGLATLLSMYVRQRQALCPGEWVQKWVWLVRYGSSFRLVGLCLASIEPFRWSSDSSNAMIGFTM